MIPLGLEPRTLSLKVRCSNQLSYEIGFQRIPGVGDAPPVRFGGAKIDRILLKQIPQRFFFESTGCPLVLGRAMQPLSVELGLSFAR